MAIAQQRVLSTEEFLDLLDDRDVEALWEVWELPQDAPKVKKSALFAAAVAARSKTSLLQDVLRIATPSLRMLQDILKFLLSQKASVRTTGSHIVLEDKFDMAPQKIEAALVWSKKALQRYNPTTWANLLKRFTDEIVPLCRTIANYGKVQDRKIKEKWTYKGPPQMRNGGSGIPRIKKIVSYDKKGWEVRQEFIKEFKDLNSKVDGLRGLDIDSDAKKLLSLIEARQREQDRNLLEDHEIIKSADRRSNPSSGIKFDDKDREIWKCFVEDLLFLANAQESTDIIDVFRMDLFRNRPQLYEMWVLIVVLDFMRRAGYKVELLGLHTEASGRVVWNLKYAQSNTAVARLYRASDNSECFLFYQLFRLGESRDHMPDIALMPSDRATDRPIWIMDPKHSERSSYTLEDYTKVGSEYQSTFEPKRTWIIEYYSKPNLAPDTAVPLEFATKLICDVSPQGIGYDLLMRELEEIHGKSQETTLAVIDVSGSFLSKLARIQDDLKRRLEEGTGIADKIVWFADRAMITRDCLDLLKQDRLEAPTDLGGSTKFVPALKLLEQLLESGKSGYVVRIYTDGNFIDIPKDKAFEQLRSRAKVEMINFH